MIKEYLNRRLIITIGDITKAETGAIVNAANSSLLGGGGVDGAIHAAGGPKILEECKSIRKNQYPEGLNPGGAVITTGGNLSAPFVIHTVGPVWHGGKRGEPETLYNAYFSSLLIAEKKGITSIAFPAISTGVYGYPKENASKTAFLAIRDFIKEHNVPEKITLVFFAGKDADIFIKAVEELE